MIIINYAVYNVVGHIDKEKNNRCGQKSVERSFDLNQIMFVEKEFSKNNEFH